MNIIRRCSVVKTLNEFYQVYQKKHGLHITHFLSEEAIVSEITSIVKKILAIDEYIHYKVKIEKKDNFDTLNILSFINSRLRLIIEFQELAELKYPDFNSSIYELEGASETKEDKPMVGRTVRNLSTMTAGKASKTYEKKDAIDTQGFEMHIDKIYVNEAALADMRIKLEGFDKELKKSRYESK